MNLKKYTNKYIKIERFNVSGRNICGYLLCAKGKYLLVEEILDFRSNGFVIIREKDLTKIHRAEQDEYYEKILMKEGVLPSQDPKVLKGGSVKGILERIGDNPLIIKYESLKQDRFNIGRIVELREEDLLFWYFDTCGEWDFQPIELEYKGITLIQWGDRYTEIMSKHAGRPKGIT